MSVRWFFGVAAMGMVACSGQPASEADPVQTVLSERGDVGTVVGHVNGIPVGSEDLNGLASRRPPKDRRAGYTTEEKKELLEEALVEEAMFQEAFRRGLFRDPKIQNVLVTQLMREEVFDQVNAKKFPDEELKAYYEAHKDEFVVPEKVQVRRIFIQVTDQRTSGEAKAIAEDLYGQLKRSPARFKDLALEHSDDPYKRRGGDIGYMSREGKPGIDPVIVDKAFELDVDQLAAPFEAGGGWNIIQVVNKRARAERTYSQMKGSVRRRVKTGEFEKQTEAYVESIKQKYDLKVDDKALEALKIEPRLPGGEDLSHPRAPEASSEAGGH